MSGFSFFLAYRYTLASGQSQLLAFISRVSIVGLVLAVAVLITVLSVMNGFDKALREQILALVPHVTLTSQAPVLNWQEKIKQAKSDVRVSYAEPFISAKALLIHGKLIKPGLLYGIEPSYAKNNPAFAQLLGSELIDKLSEADQLVIGKNLAQELQLKIGDNFRLVLLNARQETPESTYFTVAGIMHSGTELDGKLVLMSRENLAKLKHYPIQAADGIRVQVHDLFKARLVGQNLSHLTGLERLRDWSQSQGNLYQAIQMSRKMVVLLVFIIIAVAAFNVVSTLVLAVNDKAPDIAILRTMGASNSQILWLFIGQGSLIGALGVVIGLLLGVLLSFFIGDMISGVESLFGLEFLSSNVYPIDHLPSAIDWSSVFLVVLASFALSVLASVFPAYKASRVQPAKILRYE